MRIRKPFALKPGQGIGIVALSSPLMGEKIDRYKSGLEYLAFAGYSVKEAGNVSLQTGYLAGPDADRAAALNAMFTDPTVHALFCSRGGYGVQRILHLIDYRAIRRHPKIFVGYSDLTALQLALFHKAGLVTFSGPMVAVDLHPDMPGINKESLWRQLTGQQPEILPFDELGSPVRVYRQGVARGRLLGGCLSVICSMLGTPYCPDFRGKVLLLEDVGEDLYRIDRMFAQLKLAGVLNKIGGLILGDFPDCMDRTPDNPATLDDIIEHYTRDLNIPVIGNVHYGHAETKLTFPMGIKITLDTQQGHLKYMETAVHV